MRWFVGSAVALVLVWFLYLASPYWALHGFIGAIEAGDAGRLAERVNARAVRLSLTKQIATDGLGSRALSGALGSPDAQLTAGVIAAAADPLLEQLVTAEGIVALLPEIREGRRLTGPFRPGRVIAEAGAFLQVSRWRGFRNVYFTLPPEAPQDRRVRLQFRLSRLSWRLVGIEPTPETRQRLLADLIRLKRPGGP